MPVKLPDLDKERAAAGLPSLSQTLGDNTGATPAYTVDRQKVARANSLAAAAPQAEPPGLLDDAGNLLKMGVGQVGRGAGYLTGSESLEQAGAGMARRAQQALSPEQQQAGQNEFVTHSDEEGYGVGPALTETPGRSIGGALASSLPATGAGMATGAGLSYGIKRLAGPALSALGAGLTTWAPHPALKLAGAGLSYGGRLLSNPVVAGAIGFGAGEGLVSAGVAGSDVKEFVQTADQKLLDQAPGYQELIAQGMDPATAREALADELAGNAALGSGAVVAALGAPLGAMFGSWLGGVGPKTIRGGMLHGGLGEAGQEAGQSAAEEYVGGTQRAQIDPTQAPTLASMTNQAVGGALAGGVMGGGFGAFQGRAQQKRDALLEQARGAARQAQQEREAQAARDALRQAERVPGLAGLRERQARAEAPPVSVTDPRRFVQPIAPETPLQPGDAVMSGTDIFEVVNDADTAVTLRAESGEEFIINRADLAGGYQKLDADAWLEATNRTRGVRALPSPGTDTVEGEFTDRPDQRLLSGPGQRLLTGPTADRPGVTVGEAERPPTREPRRPADTDERKFLTLENRARNLEEKGKTLPEKQQETLNELRDTLLNRPVQDERVRALLDRYGEPTEAGGEPRPSGPAGLAPDEEPSSAARQGAEPSAEPTSRTGQVPDGQATPQLPPDQAGSDAAGLSRRPEPTTDQPTAAVPAQDTAPSLASTPEPPVPAPPPDTADTSRPSQTPANEGADSVAPQDDLGTRRKVMRDRIGGPNREESTLTGRARIDNVDHELWEGADGAAVRVYDAGSGNLVGMKAYKDREEARKAFEESVSSSGGTPEYLSPPAPPGATDEETQQAEAAPILMEQQGAEGRKPGEVGMMLSAGEVVTTTTGRETTPFPKITQGSERKTQNTVRRVDQWLMQNALDEAKARGDEFNARQFEANLKKPTPADRDSAEYYLFDPEFNVPVPRSPLRSPDESERKPALGPNAQRTDVPPERKGEDRLLGAEQPDVQTKTGKPFTSRKRAEFAAKAKGMAESHEPVETAPGQWVLRAKVPAESRQGEPGIPAQSRRIPPSEAPAGKRTRATTPRGTEVEADFVLADAGTLITSNDAAGNVNPNYPAALQPRDRQRATSQTQVNRIARGIRPELLGESGTATGGAPIIGPDGVVESGNGRTLALQQAYREGGAEGYKQWLRDNAQRFGVTPEQVDAMDAPVLVRRRATEMSDAERARFARESNQSDVQAMSPSEVARADAERITDDMLKGFAPSEDGNVLAASNRGFVQAFANTLGETEAAGLRDADGNWTRQMRERITSAVFAKAYGSDELLALQAEDANPDNRNIVNALVTAAGEFARARATDATLGNLDIVTPLVEAVGIIRSTEPGRLEERLGQADMFGGDVDADVATLARFISANKKSARRMGEAFRAMAQYIRSELSTNARLIGEPASRGEIIESATRKGGGQQTLAESADGGSEGGQPDQERRAKTADAAKAEADDKRQQFPKLSKFVEWALGKATTTTETVEYDGKPYTKTDRVWSGNMGGRAAELRQEIGKGNRVGLINQDRHQLTVQVDGKNTSDRGKVRVHETTWEPVEAAPKAEEVAPEPKAEAKPKAGKAPKKKSAPKSETRYSRAKQPTIDSLETVTENGNRFETGRPVTFSYGRNPERAPNLGGRFQQDIEPSGRYLIATDSPPEGWETGTVTFNNPLVIRASEGGSATYDETSWKAALQRAYGKKGRALNRALKADGYDGIVTVQEYKGEKHTGEIVQLGDAETRYSRTNRDAEYLAAVERGDMETAQRMVLDAAEASGLPILEETGVTAYRVRRSAAPEKTVKAYKLFRAKKSRPGDVFALFVGAADPLPEGVWLDATEGPKAQDSKTGKAKVKSKLGNLAYRPGWHAGDIPLATHIGAKDEAGNVFARKDDEVWAEVEMAADVDYQPEADANGTRDDGRFVAGDADIKHMPDNGLYRYKTNPNMTGQWIISGSMKINRVLSESEVNAILKRADAATMPWATQRRGSKRWTETPLDLSRWGLDTNPAKNQKKLLDPVTRDDAGNVIPLSQRFDPTNPDIRYSRRSADTTDRAALGRSLLARNRGDVAAAQREAKALYPGLSEDINDWIDTNRDRWQASDDIGTMYSRANTPDEARAVLQELDARYGQRPTLKDRVGNTSEWFGSLSRSNRRLWLNLLTRQQIVDVGKDVQPLATEFEQLARQMDADANKMITEHGKVIERWAGRMSLRAGRKGKDQAALLARTMHEATIAGFDPSTGKPDSPEERQVAKMWAALDADSQKLFTDVRDAYAARREELERALVMRLAMIDPRTAPKTKDALYRQAIDALMEREAAGESPTRRQSLTALRMQMENNRVKGPYFPLSRFGDYYVVATKDGEEKQVMRFERGVEWRRVQRELESEGWTVKAGKDVKNLMTDLGPSANFMKDIFGVLDSSDAGLDQAALDAIKDDMWQMYLMTLPDQSIRKHFIHRQNRRGFSQDALRAFAHHMHHSGRQIARMRYSSLMADTLTGMKANIEGNADPEKASDILDGLGKSFAWMMNPTTATWATRATSFGFGFYLGVSPAAAMINMTQVPIVSLPILGAQYGGIKATKALSVAMKDYSKAAFSTAAWEKLLATPGVGQMLQEIEDSGAVDRTLASSVLGLDEENVDIRLAEQKAMEKIGFLFHKAERWNREVTAIAAYRLARDAGKSHEQGVLEAYNAIFETQFDYSGGNRAAFMRGNTARVLLLFRQYSQNMTYLLWRNFQQSFRGEGVTPEETRKIKRIARNKLMGVLGTTAVFAGAMGMPLMGVMLWVSQMAHDLLDDDDEEWDAELALRQTMNEWLGPVADVAARGVFGAGIGTRTSLDELWVRSPYGNLEGRDLAYHYLEQAAGPVVGIGVSAFRGIELMSRGNIQQGFETALPKVIKDVLRAERYYDEGVQSLRGDQVVGRDELDWFDLALQASGVAPHIVTERYEQNRNLHNLQDRILGRRRALINRYYLAWRDGDTETVRETVRDMRAFSQANPRATITADTIRQSIRARARTTQQRTLSGSVFDQNLLPYLREQQYLN